MRRFAALPAIPATVAYTVLTGAEVATVRACVVAVVCFVGVVLERPVGLMQALAIAALVIYQHRGNITRLARGEEPKFSLGNKDAQLKRSRFSGITAPASVPHVITVESFHHSVVSPPKSGIMAYETMYVAAMETSEVIQTSEVSGASKFILSAFPYLLLAITPFNQYETPEEITIITRMAKIQTRSWLCTSGLETASTMNVISATPVTP